MSPHQLGADQNIVYISNAVGGTVASLKRYDVQTKVTTTILKRSQQTIESAQLSNDGQWILFSTMLYTHTYAIQLIRIDGKFLQTLYCASSQFQMQWSPDQKMVLFDEYDLSVGNNSGLPATLYLLHLSSGRVQVEMSSSGAHVLITPATWLDNTRVYVTSGFVMGGGVTSLYILDTSKGPNQSISNLQLIKSDPQGFGFDSSYDGSKLFILSGKFDKTSPDGIYQIDAMSTDGTHSHTIFGGFKDEGVLFSGLRVIGYNSSSILFIINGGDGHSDLSKWGLWKINADGTGLMHLNNEAGTLNHYSQYPWSNFSRDGAFYADDVAHYGSLSGGPLIQYADGSSLLVGWTTM